MQPQYNLKNVAKMEPANNFICRMLELDDSACHVNDDDCRSGSLPEVLQYRVWPVSKTETFNTQVHWLNLAKEI